MIGNAVTCTSKPQRTSRELHQLFAFKSDASTKDASCCVRHLFQGNVLRIATRLGRSDAEVAIGGGILIRAPHYVAVDLYC